MTGSELKSWRKKRRLKQLALADMLGVKQSTVSKWEKDLAPIDRRTVVALYAIEQGNIDLIPHSL